MSDFTVKITPGCHTIGNVLNEYLMKDNPQMLCSYKVAHPLSKSVEITLNCNDQMEALEHIRQSCDNFVSDLSKLTSQFEKELNNGGFSLPIEFIHPLKKIEIRKGSVSNSSMC